MNIKEKFIKVFAILTLGIAALSLSLTGMNHAVTHSEMHTRATSCFPTHVRTLAEPTVVISEIDQPPSRLLPHLFHLLFILFIISPPLIALFLFLIWRELKARNELK